MQSIMQAPCHLTIRHRQVPTAFDHEGLWLATKTWTDITARDPTSKEELWSGSARRRLDIKGQDGMLEYAAEQGDRRVVTQVHNGATLIWDRPQYRRPLHWQPRRV